MPLPPDLPIEPESRVLRQLVEALIFEGIVTARMRETPHGPLRFEWEHGGDFYRCEGEIGAFGRPRVVPNSLLMRRQDGIWMTPPLRALAMALPGDSAGREALILELERTIDLCRWNARHLPRLSRREMTFAELDSALDEGHPYHPSFKARTGFDGAAHRDFGPEAGRAFRLRWLAVDASRLERTFPVDEERFWHAELGAETYAVLRARRDALGLSADEFGLLPLHPWQWAHLKEGALAPWLKAGIAHGLGEAGDCYRASQSVRTLWNADHPGRAYLKLALDIVNTSSRRTIPPHFVKCAPPISRWIDEIVRGDPAFEAEYPLEILPEYAGICARGEGALSGQLAAIWRRSVDGLLRAGEAAVPFNALGAEEADSRLFITDWLRRYEARRWVEQLLRVTILPVWHLLAHHGIAVEAHGQNMVLVHEDGWPKRLILRDFHESMEFMPGFLREPAKAPDFAALDPVFRDAAPNEFHAVDTLESLRCLVMDTLFVFHLADLSHVLAAHDVITEEEFWSIAGGVLDGYAADDADAGRQALLRHAEGTILTESLLRRKFFPTNGEYFHTIPNALAPFRAAQARRSHALHR